MKQYLKKAAGVLLSVALLVTCLPLGALVSFAAEEGQLVADHQTLDGWKDLFNENSSEYAGRIWLDKSVLTSASDLQAWTVPSPSPAQAARMRTATAIWTSPSRAR